MIRKMPPEFEVWMEGYRVTGNSSTAERLGSAKRDTFRDACDAVMQVKRGEGWEINSFYDRGKLTYWGCKLFNNEAEARKSFG